MRYVVRKSVVRYVGTIWQGITCAQEQTLSAHDLENMRDSDGDCGFTRDSLADWLSTHTGDFQSIDDFYASIEWGDETLEFEWTNEESELTYNDCMFGSEV